MRFGQLALDASHILGGAVLALSFVLLYQRRVGAVIRAYAAQAWVLAAAAAWQGWVQDTAALYLAALIILGIEGILAPLALRRIVRRLAIGRMAERALGVLNSTVLGVLTVGLSVLVVLPITLGTGNQAMGDPAMGNPAVGTLTREDLAFALSVVLLGLLTTITRRIALTQLVGVLSLGNGVVLAAVGVPGMPLVAAWASALLSLLALLVFGLFVFRVRDRLGSLDVSILDQAGRAEP